MGIDPDTERFFIGCLVAVGGSLLLLAALTLIVVGVAHGQTLVSLDRADYRAGQEHIECWLLPRPAAAQYVTGTLVVDCQSDLDGLFRNGFEVAA